MTRRLKLTVAYLGTPYHGWQRQASQRTVQGELERALLRLTRGSNVSVVGAGRTDAGVHAAAQVAHLDLEVAIPPAALARALNHLLPPEIRIRSASRASSSFHARRSARAKYYAYRFRSTEPRLPWLGLRVAVLPTVTDWDALAAALELLEGRHDMASFTVPDHGQPTSVRTLFRVWSTTYRQATTIHFVGEGFLRYQVRRMVGAALEVGRAERTLGDLAQLLHQPTPGAHLPTAPARGLTLERVYYRWPPVRARGTAGASAPDPHPE